MTGTAITAGDDGPAILNPRRLILVEGRSQPGIRPDPDRRIGATDGIWIGENAPAGFTSLPNKDAPELLGTEHRLVVLDAQQGVDPEALGIAAGCIPAGGVLVLWLPDRTSDHSAGSRSPYHRRLLHLLDEFPEPVRLDTGAGWILPMDKAGAIETEVATGRTVTHDQELAVKAVEHVLSGQRRKPALLISDRGRGKSAALGIAAGRILKRKKCRILVSGRGRAAANVVFRHALDVYSQAFRHLHWVGIDNLLNQNLDADLLLVDEAAGIPLDSLETLLALYPRIAMATTVHGYEGSGRGFLLKFREILERHSRGWHPVTLDTPVRWAPGDLLEARINQLLLLDVEMPAIPPDIDTGDVRIIPVTGQELAADEDELRAVFSLLVTAHYRTRPRDLKHLLDNEALLIYRMRLRHAGKTRTVGVLLAVREKAPDPVLGKEIALGLRRPGSHVLAELLAGQPGVENAVNINLARIQRIVIHPSLQRQGLGRRLLHEFCEDPANGSSLVGTQFALAPDLVNFWRSAGFVPVRVGSRHSRFAGEVSGLFLRSLDTAGDAVVSAASAGFGKQFPASLPRLHRGLDPEIVLRLLSGNSAFAETPESKDMDDVAGFCFGNIAEASIPQSLSRVVLWGLAIGGMTDAGLCVERVLQGKNWSDCRCLAGDEGQRCGTARLRKSCSALLQSQAGISAGESRSRIRQPAPPGFP